MREGRRTQRGDERIDGLPQHVPGQQEEGRQSAEDVHKPLKEQVRQRMSQGEREQWDEHSVPIELPLERRPALQADKHGKQ